MATLFVDQLTVLDCAVLDCVRGLLGRSWIVDIELQGQLDDLGMVFDFGPAKRAIKQVIDAHADHKLLVPMGIPGLRYTSRAGQTQLDFTDGNRDQLSVDCPDHALGLLQARAIKPPMVAAWLERQVLAAMPGNVTDVAITLRPEVIDGAQYSYCHGLKSHAGHCQRIAHGHRSRLEICVDGERDTAMGKAWALGWQDAFLGNRRDLVDETEEQMRFAYDAREGHFELALPAARCALLDADTTVENIATHIAQALKRKHPGQAISVRAFEGVNKGAIACA